MPRLEYERSDQRVVIRRRGKAYEVTILDANGKLVWSTTTADLAATTYPTLPVSFDPTMTTAPPNKQPFERVVIDADDAAAAAFAFETLPDFPAATVRVSRVRPRVADIDPAYPFRILETGASRIKPFLDGWFDAIINSGSIVAEHAPLPDVESYLRANDWATLDIFHIDHFVTPGISERDVLRESSVDRVGTLGWLLRIADLWQTRLVVLEDDGTASGLLRRLAWMLVERGGPAVLLIPPASWQALYQDFVHDRPIDWIAATYNTFNPGSRMTLFAGEDREELVRYSTIAALLAKREVAAEIGSTIAKRHGQSSKPMIAAFTQAATSIASTLEAVTFEFSEGRGMVPIKGAVDSSVGAATKLVARMTEPPRMTRSGRPSRTRGSSRQGRKENDEKKAARNVNAAFFRRGTAGEMVQLPQSELLCSGDVVHFGVQIGPRDEVVKTVGRSSLIEEQFRWKEQTNDGVTIEIAVSGLDFDVCGAEVQRVWLPRTGTTDRVFFAVTPRADTAVPGVARLRYTIFYRHNVVQSFRMAALLGEKGSSAATRLARALDVDVATVSKSGDVGWLSTIEYANATLHEIESLPGRALTIIANESAGQKVFTAKGEDLFNVTINNDVPALIGDMRNELRTLSAESNAQTKYRYRFGSKDNYGDPAELAPTLFRIANLGWQLYSAIINDADDRQSVDEILGASEEIIHVADVALGDIVPWSLLYDREVDPAAGKHKDLNGVERNVTRELCMAAWPNADGTLPATKCGGPGCLLSEEKMKERAQRPLTEGAPIEETIICPLHFWGYKHQIEVPVQQTKDKRATDTVAAAKKPPARTRPFQVAAAINRKLPLYEEHEKRLTKLFDDNSKVVALASGIVDDRDRVKELLGKTQPDVIYLYCHAFARQQMQDGTITGPNLGFSVENDQTGFIAAPNLTGNKWQRGPLVFLNGCSTVGFNPYAPSPFVVQLVKTRGASALIGTEVTVWEILAAEMAESFLQQFFDNASAGAALRTARRLLLRKYNPLGLVYTLYGKADLTLT